MKKTLITLAFTFATSSAFAAMDHSKMDHGDMEHSQMNHGEMDHSEMGHSKMDHSMMDMAGMSQVGMVAQGAKPDKVVHVILKKDMTISFKKPVTIASNDVVQFVILNTTGQAHQFSIGSPTEQQQARAGKADSGVHQVEVAAGKAQQLLWHFHGEKQVELACNQDGHAKAGMVKTLTVQ
ncbi:copper-binding protein [Motilimonas pumila]|uniref:Copper-binding protein n=2 Tax=Motilimonas pumila TaxID=2303987 RepID=A0A418YEC6_9GAMM|nr:copper-binding protein [Motilimonas pumila]